MKLRALPPMWGITVVRVMAGVILVVAGLDKLNGGGFEAFTKTVVNFGLPLPEVWGVFIPLLELLGGVLIAVGLGARWVAVLFIVEFTVTTFVLKAQRPPPFGGWNSLRIDLMLLATAVTVVLVGPGALALESLLNRSRRGSAAALSRGRPLAT